MLTKIASVVCCLLGVAYMGFGFTKVPVQGNPFYERWLNETKTLSRTWPSKFSVVDMTPKKYLNVFMVLDTVVGMLLLLGVNSLRRMAAKVMIAWMLILVWSYLRTTHSWDFLSPLVFCGLLVFVHQFLPPDKYKAD